MDNIVLNPDRKKFLLRCKYATYVCSSKEEYKNLFDYLSTVCGFRPISDMDYENYPVIQIINQERPYDILYMSLPIYSPALKDDIHIYNCKTLEDFIEYTDYNNRIWK